MVITACEFISGWLSGVVGIAFGYPLDTVKVRMQTLEYKNINSVIRNTFRHEGFRGFFKGLTFPLAATGIRNALFFGVYGNSLRYITGAGDKTLCCEDTPHPHTSSSEFWHSKSPLAGLIAGIASTPVSCPVECVKTQMQVNKKSSSGSWVLARTIIKKRGVVGIYQGYTACMLRDGTGFAVYILAYEHFLCMMEGTIPVGAHHKISSEVFSGGSAGAISWTVAMPFDVVKSRLQMDDQSNPKYLGMIDCFRKSFKKDGLSVFFKGLGVAVVRSFPVNAVTFVVYQWAMRECKRLT